MTKENREAFGRLCNLLANSPGAASHDWATDAETLRRAAMTLHRIAERQCCEDTACERCAGNGFTKDEDKPPVPCGKCARTGDKLGPREAGATRRASEVAARYGFRVYVQGDPRGWPLYLIRSADYPDATGDPSAYSSRGFAVCPR